MTGKDGLRLITRIDFGPQLFNRNVSILVCVYTDHSMVTIDMSWRTNIPRQSKYLTDNMLINVVIYTGQGQVKGLVR